MGRFSDRAMSGTKESNFTSGRLQATDRNQEKRAKKIFLRPAVHTTDERRNEVVFGQRGSVSRVFVCESGEKAEDDKRRFAL